MWTVVVAVVVVWNLVTWAVYRLDKARARRQERRIPERVLLGLAAAGGSAGALLAVYAHRQRHKARKLAFVGWLWAIVAAQVGVVVVLVRA